MSGQWLPDQRREEREGQKPSKPEHLSRPPGVQVPPPLNVSAPKVRLLTTKNLRDAHERVSLKRFPTVDQYVQELTKELNIELQKQE